MKKIVFLVLVMSGLTYVSSAQSVTLYNTISGVVWVDADSSNTRNSGEPLVPGILVTLMSAANDSAVSSAISDMTGTFTLKNFTGTGTYYLNYVFPSTGYNAIRMRVGTDDAVNSAADSLTLGNVDNYTVSTPPFTIATNANLNTYGLGLHRIGTTLTYWSAQPMTATGWNRTFRLPKSNNARATANRASILINEAVIHPFIGFENTGAGSDMGTVEGSGRITATLPAGSIPQVATSVVKSVSFAAYDGVTDYSGTSGYSWDSSFGASHSTVNIVNSTQLTNAYRTASAADSLSISAAAVSATTITGSANLQASVSTISGAGVFITYTYPVVVALPIRFTSFAGNRSGSNAVLQWQSQRVDAGAQFVIERSSDGESFLPIGTAAAVQDAHAAYTFTDPSPLAGVNYYRLKLIAAGSTAEYSQTVPISFDHMQQVAVYPNPADKELAVVTAPQHYMQLLDALGRTVRTGRADLSGNLVLDVATLPAGLYLLTDGSAAGTTSGACRVTIRH